MVRVFPRCSKTKQAAHSKPSPTGRQRRAPLAFTLEAIEQYYNVPQADAANELGVSVTTMKQICRRLGIDRWPYQRPCHVAGSQGRRTERQDLSSEGAGSGDPSFVRVGPVAGDGDGRATTPLSLSNLTSETASSLSSPFSLSDSSLSSQSTPTTLRTRSFNSTCGQAQVDPSAIAICWEPRARGFPVRPTHLRPASSACDVTFSPGLPASVPQEFPAHGLSTSSMPCAGSWGKSAEEDITRGDDQDCEGLPFWLPPPPPLLPRVHTDSCAHNPCQAADGFSEEGGDYRLHVSS
jgi:hypothetical protein